MKSKIDNLFKIAKNSLAMITSAVLAKGGGLIVTILIARYLTATSLGIYAVVLSTALVLEIIIPLGQQEVIIRSVARDRSLLIFQWMNGSFVSIVSALGFSILLLVLITFVSFDPELNISLVIAALGLPFAGLNRVAQAVLQGAEQMKYQPLAALIGRISGLVFLWLALELGYGVGAAFIGRVIFQLISFAILAFAILCYARKSNLDLNWQPNILNSLKSVLQSLPFAFQRLLNEGSQRLQIIILPMLLALEAVGQFNAANQITLLSSSIIPILMLAILPVFSRSFNNSGYDRSALSNQTLKFLLIMVVPFVFVVAVFAQKIITLLYGNGFGPAVTILQIIIWSQILVAADSVMIQNMIASDNERPMVIRSAIGVMANIILTVLLGYVYGIFGVAVAVLLSRLITLILNIFFIAKHVCKIDFMQSMMKPFVCAMFTGLIAFLLADQKIVYVITAAAIVYFFLLILFKIVTLNEIKILRELSKRFWGQFFGMINGKKIL